ncbi:hypothetical protein NGM37_40050, partial [Streptomyces sp. TRM76130]|nr:hypothetical protein [Streptomyces sp. TRM76130]
MQPAVPEPSPPPEGTGLPPVPSGAPVLLGARNNRFMSESKPQAEVQHTQPSVGSIAAHRPHTIAAVVSDLEPDLDSDLDTYEDDLDGPQANGTGNGEGDGT